jgi:hypothetical protein
VENSTHRKKSIKPTPKQRRAARLMADVALGKHKGKIETRGDIAVAAGYSETSRLSPDKVLDKPGVKMALDDLGFNSENAKSVVQSILNSTEAENRDRLRAADLVFKVQGDFASDKIAASNTNSNPIIIAKIQNTVINFEAELKKALGYDISKTIKETGE